MKKFFSLVLALVMALSLTTVAFAATTEVTTPEQLAAALKADAEQIDVVLKNDISVPVADLSNYGQTPGSGEYKMGSENTKAINIDLGGYKLTLTTSYMTAIGAKNENATITIKNGSMNGTGNSAATWNINDLMFANCNYVFEDVTFDKEVALVNTGKTTTMKNVTIKGTGDYYALWIQAEGQTVEIDGLIVNTPGRGIKIDEQYSGASVAKVTLDVSNAEFTTAKKSAIMVKSAAGADIVASDCDISGVAEDSANLVWVDEDAAASAKLVSVTGATGLVEGTAGVAQVNNMKYGTVADAIAAAGANDEVILLDDSATIPDGYTALANGTVVPTPAAGATDPVLYVADNSAAGWATYYIATGADLDDLKQGADENCLPCYLINGDYYTEVSPAIATYKLAYGAKTVYLNPVDSTDVCYDAEAKVFTNITKKTDECGKLVVTDTTKTYYVFYDELDDDEDYYFVATKNGSIQLLVNGKIVDVELHTVQALTTHKWFGYDVVNNAYTTIKCENCEKVAKLYANKTAAGKNAVYVDNFGWITAADAVLPGTVVAPSTDKVTSAETFDAGIAMYVGMSVMAAAGSAVVLKKRED